MTTNNPHHGDMIVAATAYSKHIRAIQTKYGHLHNDDRLTVDEATERVILSGNYKEQSHLFVAYKESHRA